MKAGKEILKKFNESDQQKYYFKLFAAGKDVLTQEGNTHKVIFMELYSKQCNDLYMVGFDNKK